MVLAISEPASASELVLGPDAGFVEVVADVGLGGDKKFWKIISIIIITKCGQKSKNIETD